MNSFVFLFLDRLAVGQAAQAMRSLLQRKLLLEEDLRMPLLQLEGEEILGKERHVQIKIPWLQHINQPIGL